MSTLASDPVLRQNIVSPSHLAGRWPRPGRNDLSVLAGGPEPGTTVAPRAHLAGAGPPPIMRLGVCTDGGDHRLREFPPQRDPSPPAPRAARLGHPSRALGAFARRGSTRSTRSGCGASVVHPAPTYGPDT